MTTTTEAEAHKAVVTRFVDEFWSGGNLDAADDLMTHDVVIHEPPVGGREELKAFATALRTAFPDWHSTVEEMLVEGDRVVERWTGYGTHRGPFQGIAPTGKRVAVPGVVFYRITNGQIAEFRGWFDRLSLLQQLGVIAADLEPATAIA